MPSSTRRTTNASSQSLPHHCLLYSRGVSYSHLLKSFVIELISPHITKNILQTPFRRPNDPLRVNPSPSIRSMAFSGRRYRRIRSYYITNKEGSSFNWFFYIVFLYSRWLAEFSKTGTPRWPTSCWSFPTTIVEPSSKLPKRPSNRTRRWRPIKPTTASTGLKPNNTLLPCVEFCVYLSRMLLLASCGTPKVCPERRVLGAENGGRIILADRGVEVATIHCRAVVCVGSCVTRYDGLSKDPGNPSVSSNNLLLL